MARDIFFSGVTAGLAQKGRDDACSEKIKQDQMAIPLLM
jgi:hypothetical protein